MSEYQYYEFAALDRPLTRAQMAELRAVSTRAEVTPGGFVNHYEWGDLKADPIDWMRRYFDAFVYVANWGSARLALRLPRATFRKDELAPFLVPHALTAQAGGDHWIVEASYHDEEGENPERFGMDDGSGWMRRLAPLRDELLRGDLRPLYLGWLAAQDEGAEDDTPEPEVPPGLVDLSSPQQALAEFLAVDVDLLAAAAMGSMPLAGTADAAAGDERLLDAWLASWPSEEVAAVLKLIAQGRGGEAERQVRSRHAAWLKAQRPALSPGVPRRRLGRLRELARTVAEARLRGEAAEHARQQTERRRQLDATLRQVMVEADRHWADADALARRATGSGYAQVVAILTALAEGYALTASRQAFDAAFRRWLAPHAKRGALTRRLVEAGLLPR